MYPRRWRRAEQGPPLGLADAIEPPITAHPEVIDTIIRQQEISGFEYGWAFDNANDPLKGNIGNVPLSISGTGINNYAPTVPGTKGYYNYTPNGNPDWLGNSGNNIDSSRNSDIWVEMIVSDVANESWMWQLGILSSSAGFGRVYITNSGFRVYNLFGNIRCTAAGLTPAYIDSPTYIAVFWDDSASTFFVYYKKAGDVEGSASGGGIRWTGGPVPYPVYPYGHPGSIPCNYRNHMFGINRGTLTSTHRNAIYALAGLT
jgi:hypothetical protein